MILLMRNDKFTGNKKDTDVNLLISLYNKQLFS